VEGKWGVPVHQTKEMKDKEGTGDPGGLEAKSGRYSSGSGHCSFGEKAFFADAAGTLLLPTGWHPAAPPLPPPLIC